MRYADFVRQRDAAHAAAREAEDPEGARGTYRLRPGLFAVVRGNHTVSSVSGERIAIAVHLGDPGYSEGEVWTWSTLSANELRFLARLREAVDEWQQGLVSRLPPEDFLNDD